MAVDGGIGFQMIETELRDIHRLAVEQLPSLKEKWVGGDTDEYSKRFTQFCAEMAAIADQLQMLAASVAKKQAAGS